MPTVNWERGVKRVFIVLAVLQLPAGLFWAALWTSIYLREHDAGILLIAGGAIVGPLFLVWLLYLVVLFVGRGFVAARPAPPGGP